MHFIYKVLLTVDSLVNTNSAKLAKTFRSDLILNLIYKHPHYNSCFCYVIISCSYSLSTINLGNHICTKLIIVWVILRYPKSSHLWMEAHSLIAQQKRVIVGGYDVSP